MTSTQFKSELKKVKETLRGQSIRVSLNGVSRHYNTLRELGNRILELEAKGCTFSFYNGRINDIEADNGINMARAIQQFGTNH